MPSIIYVLWILIAPVLDGSGKVVHYEQVQHTIVMSVDEATSTSESISSQRPDKAIDFLLEKIDRQNGTISMEKEWNWQIATQKTLNEKVK